MNKIIEKLNGKRILIWGYGREGKSTEQFIQTYCHAACLDRYEGSRDGVHEEKYDIVFVSPGIPFEEDAPLYDNARFTSQTELFLEEFGAQTIGITGTKGKSTSCALLYQVLSYCKKKTYLVGNIGKPCFDFIPQLDGESLVVFELSCHQCQRLQTSPHIAAFLDLYEDHLDRYHTMEHYFDAKCGITKHQTKDDILLVGSNVPPITTKAMQIRIAPGSEGKAQGTDDSFFPERFDLLIPGEHNQFNARFVYKIAVSLLHCDPSQVKQGMASFAGLPHRLEHCGTIDGVEYYDDSISTIPEATIRAVLSVPNAKTVLIGGMDRGIDYGNLEQFIRKHQDIYFILAYASGKRIYNVLQNCPNVEYVETLEEQVKRAKEITPKGGAVIMSNAAASYGYFKDFEERGNVFKQLIRSCE